LLGGLFVFGNTSQKKNKTRAPSKTFQTAGGMKAHNRYNVPLKCCSILSRSTTLLDAEIRWRCCIIRRKTFCLCKVNWSAHTHTYVYIQNIFFCSKYKGRREVLEWCFIHFHKFACFSAALSVNLCLRKELAVKQKMNECASLNLVDSFRHNNKTNFTSGPLMPYLHKMLLAYILYKRCNESISVF
jgi:hypothetical protein